MTVNQAIRYFLVFYFYEKYKNCFLRHFSFKKILKALESSSHYFLASGEYNKIFIDLGEHFLHKTLRFYKSAMQSENFNLPQKYFLNFMRLRAFHMRAFQIEI